MASFNRDEDDEWYVRVVFSFKRRLAAHTRITIPLLRRLIDRLILDESVGWPKINVYRMVDGWLHHIPEILFEAKKLGIESISLKTVVIRGVLIEARGPQSYTEFEQRWHHILRHTCIRCGVNAAHVRLRQVSGGMPSCVDCATPINYNRMGEKIEGMASKTTMVCIDDIPQPFRSFYLEWASGNNSNCDELTPDGGYLFTASRDVLRFLHIYRQGGMELLHRISDPEGR